MLGAVWACFSTKMLVLHALRLLVIQSERLITLITGGL